MITNPHLGQRVIDLCFYTRPVSTIIEISANDGSITIRHDVDVMRLRRRRRFSNEIQAFSPEDEEQVRREAYADKYL